MTVVSVSVPMILDEELKALVRSGFFDNKSEIFRIALREYLEKNRNLRITAAIEMYNEDKATFAKAAEIAGVSYDEMKEIFWENGIEFKRGPSDPEELEKGAKGLQESMEKRKGRKKMS